MLTQLMLENRYLPLLGPGVAHGADADAHFAALATVLGNLAYYGFIPSTDALALLRGLPADELGLLWQELAAPLARITGEDRNMAKFVVYKNFPKEVLSKSQAEYWFNQILMYLGAPADWFRESEAARPPIDETLSLKILEASDFGTPVVILDALVSKPSRWTPLQESHAVALSAQFRTNGLTLSTFGFKENGIRLLAANLAAHTNVRFEAPTDVLRLASVVSGGDASLRGKVAFPKFKRPVRKALLRFLSIFDVDKLVTDFGARPELWKKLLSRLRPGDYRFATTVSEAYNDLYTGGYSTYSFLVEASLQEKDDVALEVMKTIRPGDFLRRLHHSYAVFGAKAFQTFAEILPKLETIQLLKLQGYLRTINERKSLVFPPQGNWTKAQFVLNGKVPLHKADLDPLLSGIQGELASRMAATYPDGVVVDADAALLKLQTNDQELAPYGRGSVFKVPADVQFIRTGSYWKHSAPSTTYYDNGWNFFGAEWEYLETCCWNHNTAYDAGAIFSGDPVNTGEMEGRACQMIDLNLDVLVANGVRYAVWNVLAFSRLAFSTADEVVATLQWGVDANAGKLYEPGRAQMVFPLKGANLTKYVAFLDLKKRELVYLDANLAGSVQSAAYNGPRLSKCMPAMVEYLSTLPSIADYFETAPTGSRVISTADCHSGVAFAPLEFKLPKRKVA